MKTKEVIRFFKRYFYSEKLLFIKSFIFFFISSIIGISFGYLIGFIAGAYFTGLICEKITLTDLKKYALAVFCGLLATYIIGLSYKYFILNFYLNTPISWKLVLLSCFPIDLPCDIALSILAIILATKLKKSGGLHVKKDIR